MPGPRRGLRGGHVGGFGALIARLIVALEDIEVADDITVADLILAGRLTSTGLIRALLGVSVEGGDAAGVGTGAYNPGGLLAIAVAGTLRGFFDGNGLNAAAILSKLAVTGGSVKLTPAAITSSSNHIAVDASSAPAFTHTATENTTLDNPTNLEVGQQFTFVFTQHASAAKSLAFGTKYNFVGGVAPTFADLPVGKRAIMSCLVAEDAAGGIICTWGALPS